MLYAMNIESGQSSNPFLKWAGGKTQLLRQFEPIFPKTFNRFFEPFLGSGAVFFFLRNQGKAENAFLSERNQELIDCYLGVRDHLGEIMQYLTWYRDFHSIDQYYEVRKLDPWGLSLPHRAARLIYLNKTCFNGLYRVNKKGQFNVPMGRYKTPRIFEEQKLRLASKSLSGVDIKAMDFTRLPEYVGYRDFVYLDPPYDPLSSTSNFTGYTKNSFDEKMQSELANICRILTDRGAFVMLSNSSTSLIRDLYSSSMFFVTQVEARRSINSKGDKRGFTPELVITNYRWDY